MDGMTDAQQETLEFLGITTGATFQRATPEDEERLRITMQEHVLAMVDAGEITPQRAAEALFPTP